MGERSVWLMMTDDGFYPIDVVIGRDKPEDHGRLNPHVKSIQDIDGNTIWSRNDDNTNARH